MSDVTKDQASTPEMLAAAVNKQFQKMTEMIQASATKEDWAKLVVENKEILSKMQASDELTAKMQKDLEKMTETAKTQGATLSKLMNAIQPQEGAKSLRAKTVEILTEEKNQKDFGRFINRETNRFKIDIHMKDIAFGGTYGAGASQNAPMPFTVPTGPDYEMADIRTVVPTGTIDQNKLDYPQERSASRTDNLGFATENAETTASTYGFTMASVVGYYIKDHVKVSRFAMRDVNWLSSYLQNQMFAKLVAKLNSNVLTGTNSSNDLDGLLNNANTFAGTGMENKFANADYFSVMTAARAEMLKTYKRRGNTIILDPLDAAVIADIRSTIGGFIMNPYAGQGNAGFLNHMGLSFVEMADMTDGGYLIADLQPSTVQLLFNGPIEVLMSDSDDDNFTKDLVTLKIGATVMLPIYNTNALLKGTLATDKSTINAGA